MAEVRALGARAIAIMLITAVNVPLMFYISKRKLNQMCKLFLENITLPTITKDGF